MAIFFMFKTLKQTFEDKKAAKKLLHAGHDEKIFC